MKSYQDKPPFQGARGNHGDCNSKGCNSKASMVMYRTRQFPIGVGLASINLRVIHMNLWLKPREKRAAKRELNSFSKRLGLSQYSLVRIRGLLFGSIILIKLGI